MMKSWIVSYAAALGVLCVCDGLWLGLVARNFYKARIGQLLLAEPRWAIAVLFYLVHALGIAVFAVRPALASGSWTNGLLLGALFDSVPTPPMTLPTSPRCVAGRCRLPSPIWPGAPLPRR